MKWQFTILVNNYTRRSGFASEHGYSVLLKGHGVKGAGASDFSLLFDTGQSFEVLSANASKLNIDFNTLDAIALSHGHYDHTGGLRGILNKLQKREKPIPLYSHPEAFFPKFKETPSKVSIGSPISRAEVESGPVDLKEVSSSLQIAKNLYLTGEIPRLNAFEEEAHRNMFTEKNGRYMPDVMLDDQSLVLVKPGEGFHLICGCCHAGLLNTLKHARDIAGEERLLGVIGGLHMTGANRERLQRTIEELREWNPQFMAPLHCAGAKETAVLYRELGERVKFLAVGDTIDL